jgi:HEAT repeat protein
MFGRSDKQVISSGSIVNITFVERSKGMLWWTMRQLASKNAGTRLRATEKLVARQTPKIVKQLIVMLTAKREHVREAAANVLGEIRDESAVDALNEAARDEAWSVRSNAVQALGTIGSPRALDSLVSALEDANLLVKYKALEALKKIGDRRAVSPLMTALSDENYLVREHAAQALDALQWAPSNASEQALYFVAVQDWEQAASLGSVAVEPLAIAIKDIKEEVREKAVATLAKINVNWQGQQLAGEAAPLFARRIMSETGDAREEAACGLVRIGAPAVRPILQMLAQAYEAKDSLLMSPASEQEAERIMAEYDKAGDVYENGRYAAVETLWKIGEPAVEYLLAALRQSDDRDACVRLVAIEALGKIGDGRAVGPLLATLKDGTLRRTAIEALGKIKDGRAAEALVSLLTNGEVGGMASWALKQIGQASLESLVAALTGPDYHLRQVAASVLQALKWSPTDARERAYFVIASQRWNEAGRLGPEGAEPMSDAMKKENDWRICQTLVTALAKTGDARAVDGLVQAFKDGGSNDVWEEAMSAMQRLDESRAAKLLTEALIEHLPKKAYSADGEPCRRLMVALKKMGEARAVKPILVMVREPQWGRLAVSSLCEVLKRDAENVSTEGLREIAHLENVVQSFYNEEFVVTYGEAPVDTTEVKQLAGAELALRGLQP